MRSDAAPSRLQQQLASQIVQLIRGQHVEPGTRLTELALADSLKVSRTPVRAALRLLAEQGVVEPGERGGFRLARAAGDLDEPDPDWGQGEDEALYLRVAEDFLAGRLASDFSEADWMRRYDVGRGVLRRMLQRMARDGVIERRQGHGWRFAPLVSSVKAHDESYRFRLAIEPAAILEPGYRIDPDWSERSRREHEAILATPPDELSPIRFFEVNAAFHEMIAAGSGNSFFVEAVRQQNRLRRFLAYNWTYGHARIAASCEEHLAMLDALDTGDADWGSTLMRRHLDLAARLTPESLES